MEVRFYKIYCIFMLRFRNHCPAFFFFFPFPVTPFCNNGSRYTRDRNVLTKQTLFLYLFKYYYLKTETLHFKVPLETENLLFSAMC